jgi:pimeloyl-ACP methyl ester carboxylesterase
VAALGERRRRLDAASLLSLDTIVHPSEALPVTTRGTGPITVVVVTGAADCAASWVPVVDRVSRFARVITYDRPGVGSSPSPSCPSLDRYVADLDGVVTHTAPQGPVVLVGQSLGGLIAREYALDTGTGWPAWCSSTRPRSPWPVTMV